MFINTGRQRVKRRYHRITKSVTEVIFWNAVSATNRATTHHIYLLSESCHVNPLPIASKRCNVTSTSCILVPQWSVLTNLTTVRSQSNGEKSGKRYYNVSDGAQRPQWRGNTYQPQSYNHQWWKRNIPNTHGLTVQYQSHMAYTAQDLVWKDLANSATP